MPPKPPARRPVPASSNERDPFLRPDELGLREGQSVVLTLTGDQPRTISTRFGEQVLLSVTFKGKRYVWGVKRQSRTAKALGKALPRDVADWKDQQIGVVVGSFNGTSYFEIPGSDSGNPFDATDSPF